MELAVNEVTVPAKYPQLNRDNECLVKCTCREDEEKEACTQSCRKSGTGTSSQHPLAGSNTEMRKQWETSFLGSLRRVFSPTQLRLAIRALERHTVAFAPDLGDTIGFVINYKRTACCQTCNFSYAAGIGHNATRRCSY